MFECQLLLLVYGFVNEHFLPDLDVLALEVPDNRVGVEDSIVNSVLVDAAKQFLEHLSLLICLHILYTHDDVSFGAEFVAGSGVDHFEN